MDRSSHNIALILIVDDDLQARKFLAHIINDEDYRIIEAASGAEALAKFSAHRPGVVLLDAMMPEMDGFEVCRRIQELPGGQATEVIMVTAVDDNAFVERAFAVGVADYVTKPVNTTVLRHRVRRMVTMQRNREELAQEHALLHTVIDNLPDIVFAKDQTGRFTLSNVAHTQLAHTFNNDSVLGKVTSELYPPAIAEWTAKDDRFVLDTGQPLIDAERHSIDAEENEQIYLISKVPLYGENGEVSGLVGVSRNITEWKLLENRLRSDTERLSAIIATQHEMATAELDLKQLVRLIIERTQSLLPQGKTSIEFPEPEAFSAINRLDQELLTEPIVGTEVLTADCVRSGHIIECPDTSTDPRLHPPQDVRSILVMPLYYNRTVIGVIKVAFAEVNGYEKRDVSTLHLMTGLIGTVLSHAIEFEDRQTLLNERTAALQALRESQERFRHAFQNAPIGMALLSPEGHWLQVNPALCEILGYSEEELLKLTFYDATHWDDLELAINAMQKVLYDESNVYQLELRYLHKRKYPIWALLSLSVVRDADQQPIYLIGHILDITQRKQAEAELALARDAAMRAMRQKSDFLATMSHEIRTPLNSVVGMSALLQGTNLDEEQHEFADTIHDSAVLLLNVINDVLDFSKIEAGKLILEETDFELQSVVEGTAEMLAPLAFDKRNALITFVNPEISPVLRGDPLRLRQILLNLINNAIKFTEDGEVYIQVHPDLVEPDRVVLYFEIRDTGIGLSSEGKLRLFQAFSQTDNSISRKFGGTGLGLMISKSLVEMMGGEIGVNSVEGQGSTFWFTITVKHGATSYKALAPLPEMSVLIVAERPDSQAMLEQYLHHWRIKTQSVSTLADAIKLISTTPFDRIVLDVEGDYLEQMRLIRRTVPDVRLVIPAPFDQRLKIVEAGAVFILRPIKRNHLYNALKRRLGPDTSSIADNSQTNTVVSRPGTKPRILIAEDDNVTRKVVGVQLERFGYEVVLAANGKEAIQRVESDPTLRAILMDCNMPIVDGFEATRAIRDLQTDRHIPIIAMTANAMPGDREVCLAAGMDDYLAKPVRQDQLIDVLSRWLPSDAHLKPALLDNQVLTRLYTWLTDIALFRELVAALKVTADECFTDMRRGLLERNTDLIQEAAHKLKGGVSTYGATVLTTLCKEMQTIAQEKRLSEISLQIERIEVEFKQVLLALDIELNKKQTQEQRH